VEVPTHRRWGEVGLSQIWPNDRRHQLRFDELSNLAEVLSTLGIWKPDQRISCTSGSQGWGPRLVPLAMDRVAGVPSRPTGQAEAAPVGFDFEYSGIPWNQPDASRKRVVGTPTGCHWDRPLL
jgi:hypothetical protein